MGINTKKIDKILGFCSGVVAYQVTNNLLSGIYKNGGIFTKTGCLTIEVTIGIGVAEFMSKRIGQYRERLNKFLNEPEDVSEPLTPHAPRDVINCDAKSVPGYNPYD